MNGKNSSHKDLIVEPLDDSSLEEALEFLRRHEDFSLFLLGNLKAHGHRLSDAANSGNFKLIRSNGKIIAVFSLARRGNLLVQSAHSSHALFESILSSCKEEDIPLRGLLGKWEFCYRFWNYLKQQTIITQESFASKEILYSLDIVKQDGLIDEHVRLLTKDDYAPYKALRFHYVREKNLPMDLTEKQLLEQFLEKVYAEITWGYFLKGQMISMAELNAKAFDLAQLGGVFTEPAFRKQGFSRAVIRHLMHDLKIKHRCRKLIIFTGEENLAARKLYESFGVSPRGHFALLFGQ